MIIIKDEPFLLWIPASGPQNCFADGRYCDYTNSRVVLNYSRMIVELFQSSALGKYPLLEEISRCKIIREQH